MMQSFAGGDSNAVYDMIAASLQSLSVQVLSSSYRSIGKQRHILIHTSRLSIVGTTRRARPSEGRARGPRVGREHRPSRGEIFAYLSGFTDAREWFRADSLVSGASNLALFNMPPIRSAFSQRTSSEMDQEIFHVFGLKQNIQQTLPVHRHRMHMRIGCVGVILSRYRRYLLLKSRQSVASRRFRFCRTPAAPLIISRRLSAGRIVFNSITSTAG
ncbi:hypothetical protein EVAR_65271_1 [Eumeta japonica]|uniref:Uncharacterized protein n=1 Tax=Eumeta variegata TaxID=151549 RepID=A0A4C1ZCQ2_EUMVA|nr:hypothetical protein EVAR_65271_1 [Eumeta japonica]